MQNTVSLGRQTILFGIEILLCLFCLITITQMDIPVFAWTAFKGPTIITPTVALLIAVDIFTIIFRFWNIWIPQEDATPYWMPVLARAFVVHRFVKWGGFCHDVSMDSISNQQVLVAFDTLCHQTRLIFIFNILILIAGSMVALLAYGKHQEETKSSIAPAPIPLKSATTNLKPRKSLATQ